MFTGIVEELGEVVALHRLSDSARLTVLGPLVSAGLAYGESVSVNGCCLTVVEVEPGGFTADVIQESLDRTNVRMLRPGDRVNLERAVSASGRLGGHVVQGHVDATAEILDRSPGERWDVVRVSLPRECAGYVVDKGSICIDGVSLTVVEAGFDSFTVALIPATLEATTLGRKARGAVVNLEFDVIGKYVERLLLARGLVTPGVHELLSPAAR